MTTIQDLPDELITHILYFENNRLFRLVSKQFKDAIDSLDENLWNQISLDPDLKKRIDQIEVPEGENYTAKVKALFQALHGPFLPSTTNSLDQDYGSVVNLARFQDLEERYQKECDIALANTFNTKYVKTTTFINLKWEARLKFIRSTPAEQGPIIRSYLQKNPIKINQINFFEDENIKVRLIPLEIFDSMLVDPHSEKSIRFTNTSITFIPSKISKLKDCKIRIELNGGLISTLPPQLFELNHLSSLWLSRNKLESIPSDVQKLTNLVSLILYGNQLKTLPDEIGALSSLTSLDVHNNQLSQLPDGLCKLTQLQSLHADNNALSDLPKDFDKLTQLRWIDFSNNHFVNWPSSLGSCPAITHYGFIFTMKWVLFKSFLYYLENFNMAGNPLRSIPFSFPLWKVQVSAKLWFKEFFVRTIMMPFYLFYLFFSAIGEKIASLLYP